tara:strand:+ start:3538 stop:4095 length:558 start_codon:yes stop_codon:yes gene_type:complete
MSNFKLTDLNSITQTTAEDLLYVVQGDASSSIDIQSLVSNIPADVSVVGDVDVTLGGQYLSGGVALPDQLNSYFADKSIIQYLEINNITSSEYELDLTPYGNYTLALSASPNGVILVPIAPDSFNNGFACKLIQTSSAQIILSAGAGVTIDSLNSSLSSEGQYKTIELYKQSNGNNRFLLVGDLA